MGNAKERQVDSVFTAKETGEYRFCFNNEMSTFAEKMVDFEIAASSPLRTPQTPGAFNEPSMFSRLVDSFQELFMLIDGTL